MVGMAALYRACRQTGLLRRPWKDMDYLIDLVEPTDLHLLTLASNLYTSCAKQFSLAVGVELAAFSKDRCDKRDGNPRAPLPSKPRIERRRLRVPRKAVHEVAACKQIDSGVSPEQRAIKTLHEVAANLLNDAQSKIDAIVRARWQQYRGLTSIELLEVLKTTLEVDEERMHLDCHQFFLTCATTLINFSSEEESRFELPVHSTSGKSSSII